VGGDLRRFFRVDQASAGNNDIFHFGQVLPLLHESLSHHGVSFVNRTCVSGDRLADGGGSKFTTTMVTCLSVIMAIGIFIVLPYYLASLLGKKIMNESLLAILEGAIRITIFILYVVGISAMKDIRRLYRYHGAEHKCINCIERGKPLTVRNVMRSSRLHKRCGTSFMFFVLFVSIVLFFFIRVENPIYRVLLRVALMPVVAGISYEFIRLAGRCENAVVNVLAKPGLWLQRLTTREPDDAQIEVAIESMKPCIPENKEDDKW